MTSQNDAPQSAEAESDAESPAEKAAKAGCQLAFIYAILLLSLGRLFGRLAFVVLFVVSVVLYGLLRFITNRMKAKRTEKLERTRESRYLDELRAEVEGRRKESEAS